VVAVRRMVGAAALLVSACQAPAAHPVDGGPGTGDGQAGAPGGGAPGAGGAAGALGGAPGAGGAAGAVGGAPGDCLGGASGEPTLTTDPWPTSCLSFYGRFPASACLLTGPSASTGFGTPAMSGEMISATLNGLPRSFSSSFDVSFADPTGVRIFGYGDDGELGLSAFPAAPGRYDCPNAEIDFGDVWPGSRATNTATSSSCCTIEVTAAGGVGEPIVGTFSGILLNESLNVWVNVEAGSFRVIRPSPPDAAAD